MITSGHVFFMCFSVERQCREMGARESACIQPNLKGPLTDPSAFRTDIRFRNKGWEVRVFGIGSSKFRYPLGDANIIKAATKLSNALRA